LPILVDVKIIVLVLKEHKYFGLNIIDFIITNLRKKINLPKLIDRFFNSDSIHYYGTSPPSLIMLNVLSDLNAETAKEHLTASLLLQHMVGEIF
jgi:hypothetical protein